jgi:aminopeptidase N
VATVTPPATPPPEPRDDGRLPRLATPLHYELSLTVDPDQPRYTGAVRVLVSVPASTSYVVMNGRGLTVHAADAQVGQTLVHASVTPRTSKGGKEPEELVLTFDTPLPAGEAVLDLTYDAPFDPGLAGLYRVKDGGRWYAFSQFEANDARRAFPCFDEPGFKVPFDVRITAPNGLLAVSNMPEARRTPGETQTRVDFQTSPPLPTYLVAFAVGDFDVRQGPTSPVPIRLLATKGKGDLGAIALEDTAALTAEIAAYFHIAYPYPKLDVVAVPDFAAGAMENAGLITFRDETLLLDPAHPSRDARIGVAETIAHELAHQWFGDLVTMAWWDDLWLNEGFATWAETKFVEHWQPSFHVEETSLAGLGGVMALDSLKSARAVRQPVRTTAEADEAFDRLTYEKGAAVLRMLEQSVGPEAFRRGVEGYLRAHAWKNATADDLFHAIGEASGTDVSPVAASFLDRPGVPSVRFTVDCAAKPPVIKLEQSPWRPLGAADDASAGPPWLVPIDLRTDRGEKKTLLVGPTGTVPLDRCPAWVEPNAGSRGYYRYALGEAQWKALARELPREDVADRVGFLNNAWASVKAGSLAPETLLQILPALDTDRSRVVVDAEIEVLSSISHALVSDAARPAFARYVAARLAPHEKALSQGTARALAAAGSVPQDEALLRRALFQASGALADDPRAFAEASKLSAAWLADPASVDGDLARVAVGFASRKAGPERIEVLLAAMKRAKNPSDRRTALLALGDFEDPGTLERGLDVILTDAVAAQDVFDVLAEAAFQRHTHLRALDWLKRHWDAVRAKLPSFYAGYAFSLGQLACTEGERRSLASFFGARVDQVEGAKRPWAQSEEAIGLCVAVSEGGTSKVDRFFQVKRPGAPAYGVRPVTK